jgi:hypothetical protein
MKLWRAVGIGVLGDAIVMAVVWLGGRMGGTSADLAGLTAACATGRADGSAWLLGLVLQLVLGACAALVYAALFEWLFERAGAWLGLAVAVPHAVIAGLIVGFLPADRLMAAGVMPPGAFYEFRGGWCIVAFVVAHLAFGWLVGAAYGATRHAVRGAPRTWFEVPRSGDSTNPV